MRSILVPLTTLLLASTAFAQTWTNCNPLNATCPSDTALGTNATFNFTSSLPDLHIWNTTAGTLQQGTDGAAFVINKRGDSPTIQSLFYIFFGRVEVVMQAAAGTGIVSSIVLESDDLDEVDWEMIGGNTTFVETNFFGKGNTTLYDRAVWYPIDNTLAFHNYTTIWTAEKLEWYVDGNLVRTLNYNDSLALYGKNYPQTPMGVRLGIWAGGDPTSNSNGTVEWAGGITNYKEGPFTMTVASLYVEDFSTGKSYTYGDKTGSWESIQITPGNSTIYEELYSPHGISGHFNALSKAAKLGIAIAAISVVTILLALLVFCCIKQRRAGRRERAIADAEWERNQNELQQYKRMHFSETAIHPRMPGMPAMPGNGYQKI